MAAVSPAAASSAKSSGSSCSPLERSRVVAFARSNAASKASFSSSFFRTSSLFRPFLASRPSLIIRLSCGASGLNSGGGLWEDSDDGDGSQLGKMNDVECDDEEEENLPIGEEERASSSYDGLDFLSEDERLQHEVHLLLNPEERAILEQNETPNLSKISSNKWRPFSTRALSGQIPFMGVLLQNGLNIDAIDKDGLTALHWAVIGKKEAVISHLLRRGANPHLRDMDGATPLHYAVQVGAIQTVKLLIKYKVDVNAADHEGWTPLHLAVQSRSRDIAKVLLVNGADKNRKNKDGKTPLDLSLCYGKDFKSYELAKLIKLVPANRELGPQF